MPGFWNSKTDEEIKKELFQQLNIQSFKFIGRFKKNSNGFSFFDNIRLQNFSPLPKIKSNVFDDTLVNSIVIFLEKVEYKMDCYYSFEATILPQVKRRKHNNEFLFFVNNAVEIIEYKPDAEDFTKNIYNRFFLADTANNNDISKAINTITFQINKKPETFIYELLQNADDNAGNNKVHINFYVTDSYLLVTHNGEPFEFNNVFAICSVNAEDKSDDFEKIGFKGIGFKSVFKENDWVFIKSGNYNFRYDQSVYSVEKPWQLMPIWTPIESLHKSLKNNSKFLNSNVAIALKPKYNNSDILKSYAKTLELFNDERILLFLKSVRVVDVYTDDNIINCFKNPKKWDSKEYLITVNEDVKKWLNEQIRNNNQEVPSKYQDIKKFKISFAYKIENEKIETLEDSTLFNYLPLTISLGFPFLVNADFIPDGDREELYLNVWNEYVMVEIGKNLPIFISQVIKLRIDGLKLIPNTREISNLLTLNTKSQKLFEWFKIGYDFSIRGTETSPAIPFIPTQSGALETLSNILIDETGFVELLKEDFSKLTERTEKLIHKDVSEGVEKIKTLLKEYNLESNIYSIEILKADIQKPKIQEWLKLPSNNYKFLKHLFNSTDASLKALLESEAIVLSDKNELKKAIELYNQIPVELHFFKENKIHSQLKVQLEKENIVLSEINKFNPTAFYKSKTAIIINSFLTNEADTLNFWNFIYDNWKEFKDDTEIKKSLPKLNILCKPIQTDKLNIQTLGTVYLPRKLAMEDEIESILASLRLTKHFIETKFVTTERANDNQKWNEIFAAAKRGLSAVIKELIPNLKTLEDSLHFIACIEICRYWNKNKEKTEKKLTDEEITVIKQSIKLKCGEEYREPNQCVISEYYTADKRINEIMPSIILNNQINSNYQPNQTYVSEWKQFFVLIGCIDLNNEQLIFNTKVDYLLSNQESFQGNHFEIIKEFDSLLQENQTKEVKLIFDFEKKFSKLQLQTTTEGIWGLASEIHFAIEYKPELDLQSDSEIVAQFKFLSTNYLGNASIDFLTKIGVQGNFTFRNVEAPFQFYPSQVIPNKKYLNSFWKFITDSDSNIKKFADSDILNKIKDNETIEVSENIFKKPAELFSKNLSEFIDDKTLIPFNNLSKYFVDENKTVTLEQRIGINQELNISQCIALLKREIGLTREQVKDLKIVSIITKSNIANEDLISIKLPNPDYNWMPITNLFTSSDAELKNEHPSNLLDVDFSPVSTKLLVKNISSTDFNPVCKIDSDSSADAEIKKAFNERAEYIAFVLKNGKEDYVTTTKQILDSISSLTFIKCDDIYLSISHGSLEWKKSKPIHQEEEKIYFVDDLKRKKSEIRSLLYSIVNKFGTIKEKHFYNYLFDDSEKAIITELEKNEEAIPQEWIDKLREDNNDIVNSIEDVFEGMDLSDNVKAKLKTKALDIGGNLNEKEQSQHNLVAKFALIKHLGKSSMIELLDLDDSNNLQIENELYKIFSSRGEFAHIQPTALLQLKNGSCKIAIFYGSKLGVKIFSTIQSLLDLNENYIFEYQAKGDIEKIIDFLERNNIESYRFLLINPAYKNYNSKHFQNMNTEKNEEASNLI